MQADFSVELGRDDPVLELPWSSGDSSVRYYDLKKQPALIAQVPEAAAHPELSAFLARINAPVFPLQTAKCDAWHSQEILPEEEFFGSEYKFVSYIDLAFTGRDHQLSFEKHEEFAQELCKLLKRAPEIRASVEVVIRRCYYREEDQAGADCAREAGSESQNLAGAGGHVRSSEASGEASQMLISQVGVPKPAAGNDADDQNIAFLNADGSQSGFYCTVYIAGFGQNSDEARKQWSITITLVQHAVVQTAK